MTDVEDFTTEQLIEERNKIERELEARQLQSRSVGKTKIIELSDYIIEIVLEHVIATNLCSGCWDNVEYEIRDEDELREALRRLLWKK